MNKSRNNNYLLPVLLVCILLFLFAFKNVIIAAFKGLLKPAFLGGSPAPAVVTPNETIKQKQVQKTSIVKAKIENKRQVRNIKQPFLLDLPKFDNIPFTPKHDGIWNPKPYIVDHAIKPFDSSLFNQNSFTF